MIALAVYVLVAQIKGGDRVLLALLGSFPVMFPLVAVAGGAENDHPIKPTTPPTCSRLLQPLPYQFFANSHFSRKYPTILLRDNAVACLINRDT